MNSEALKLSALIGEIYDAALNPQLWKQVLGSTCAFVGGSSAALFWHDSATQQSAALHLFNEDPDYTRLYFEKYVQLNPVFPAASFMEPGLVHTSGDLVPQEEFVRTRFYREWCQPQGIIDAIAAILERGQSTSAFLNIRWAENDGPLDEGVRQRAALLIPHFQRAVAIGRLFDQNNHTERVLTETLDLVDAGVFLVNAAGRIAFANAPAEAMLEDGKLLRRRKQTLVAVAADAERMLRDIFLSSAKGDLWVGDRGVAVPLSASAADRWFAHVLPLTSGARELTGSRFDATAAVFVRRASPSHPTPLEALAKQYKLTASEIRVMDAVLKVGSVKAIADMLGVSHATAKTHLHNVFRKTGSNRQSDIVKLVAGIAT